MKKQTAVEWLANELTLPEYGDNPEWVKEVISKANEMFEQQIIDAHLKGQREDIDFINEAKQEAEQYYNETFKSE